MTQASTQQRTPLYDRHVDAGAKLVAFAGWEMPVQYAGISEEHHAVRTAAGVFDVSHMGQIETRGPDAQAYLQHLLSNDLRKLAVGAAQYSVICRQDGGVLDDLFTYRLADAHFLTVTNASNHAKDLAWFKANTDGFDVDVIDCAANYAMLAVAGPTARAVVENLSDGLLPPRFHACERVIAGAPALVCGTGYTGEDGVELLISPDDATQIWDALLKAGVTPCGLGARDTLRLEVCFHLYGHDLSEERGPIEAGLGWCCHEETGFIGSEAVRAAREVQPEQRLVSFRLTGPGIARQGNPVIGGGIVTSGTLSPSLGVAIGMAYLPLALSEIGTEIEIDVRGKRRAAIVESKPLYRKDG